MEKTVRQCIVHYDSINIKEPLRADTDVSLKSLKEKKEIRKNLGSDNYHYEQCSGIPDTLGADYYSHPECFKKFTYAKTLSKRKCNDGNSSESKIRRTRVKILTMEQ